MKARSVKYLTAEGIKNVWVNRLMSVASIGVLMACMVLIGIAILLSLNVNKSLGALAKQNVAMVYFNDRNSVLYGTEDAVTEQSSEASQTSDTTQAEQTQKDELGVDVNSYTVHSKDEALAVCKKIEKLDNVLDVEFISAEDGLESVKETMLEGQAEYFSFLDEEYGNPLSDGAKVTFKSLDKFDATLNQIAKIKGVDTIVSQSDLAKKVNSIRNGVSIAGIWIIAILMLIALVIVSNTIRITIYNRKLEITIMKAVGATDSFVRLPFVVEGLVIGLISAVISEGMVYFAYRMILDTIRSALSMDTVVGFSSVALPLLGVFAAIGIIAGALGSTIIIRKYLKKEGSEFRAFA